MSASSRVSSRALLTVLAVTLLSSSAGADGPWTIETVEPTIGLSPSLVLDANGVPSIGYSVIREPRIATRSGGVWTYQTFSTPDNAVTKPGDATQLIYTCAPSLALDPTTGQPRLAWLQQWDADLWYAQPAAGGGWSYELLDGLGAAPSIAVDPAGQVQMLEGHKYGVRSGSGWSFEPSGFIGALKIDAQGRSHALYWTGSFQDYDLGYAVRVGNGWSTQTITTDGNPNAAELAIDGAGEPHVVFFDAVTQLVRYGFRIGSTWSFQTIAGPVGHTSAVTIALGAGGEPFVSYWHLDESAQYFARRVGGVWVSELVDGDGYVGGPCSMALDASGRPHLAYTDYNSNRLRYATRADAVTGVEPPAAALGFAIASLGPNPARAGGTIDLALRLDGARRITMELLDLAGRRVAAREPVALAAGTQHVSWSPRVASGGLYFLNVRSDRGERLTTRLALLP